MYAYIFESKRIVNCMNALDDEFQQVVILINGHIILLGHIELVCGQTLYCTQIDLCIYTNY